MKFSDMFERNGRMSNTKTAFVIASATSTWAIIYVTLNGGLTEGLLAVYLGALGLTVNASKGITTYEKTKTLDIETAKKARAKPEDDFWDETTKK